MSTKIIRIDRFLGLHEAPDGDTVLKGGEAGLMRNFRVTGQGHLQLRPGYAPLCTCAEGSPVRGLWSGRVNGAVHLLAACAGQLWDIDTQTQSALSLGEIPDAPASFFAFGGKVYVLTGAGYHCWDGEHPVAEVEGYVPLVVTASPPEGGGALLERVNLLTGKRRGQYSPDGTATVFRLPESAVGEVVSVEGTDAAWTADLTAGTVTFETAPAQGVNTITITWRKGNGSRAAVEAMTRAEIYNGDTDARVFLYGDGTNRALYSDLDGQGLPTAEYFPELNQVAVDSANTPITALVRHYDRLMAFKTDGAHCVEYTTLTLDTGETTAAFTCRAVNRAIGHDPVGQALLVENSPVTLFGRGVYRWSLSAAGSRDERNAKRVSGRVEGTLSRFDLARCVTFDHEAQRELYVVYADQAVVYSYAADAWYYYSNFPARCLAQVNGELYFGTEDGRVMHFSRSHRSDDGAPIDACWESGSMDFGADHRRKYAADVWISLEPEGDSRVTVTARTDRQGGLPAREIASGFTTLSRVNFARFSFNTGRRPRVFHRRLRARRFTFYKLIFTSCSTDSTATILSADLKVETGGEGR